MPEKNHWTIACQHQMNVARFLLRDGNKVGAEVSPDGLEVFAYMDGKGQPVHALATVKAERGVPQAGALEAAALVHPHGTSPCTDRWSLNEPIQTTE